MIVPTFAEFVAESYGKKKYEAPKGVVEVPECAFIIGGIFYFMDVKAELEFEIEAADPSVGIMANSADVVYAKFLELSNVETFANGEVNDEILSLINLEILSEKEIIQNIYDYANEPNALVEVTNPSKLAELIVEMQSMYDAERLKNWTDDTLDVKLHSAGLDYMNSISNDDFDPDDEYENYRDRNDED